MTTNFFNERTKFVHRLEGLANSLGDDIALYLEAAHEQVSGKVMVLAAKAEDAKSLGWKRRYLERQKAELEGVLKDIYADIGRDIKAQAVALAQATPELVVGMIDASLPPGVVSGLEVPFLTKEKVIAYFDSFQVDGLFMNEYLGKLEANAAARIVAAAKEGLVQRGTSREIAKRLADALNTGVKSARALAGTAMHSAAIYAEVQTYTNNPNRIDGVQFMVELDRKTCPKCISQDREVFPVDQVTAYPPLHIQCRCWLYPILLTVDKDGRTVPLEDALSDWEKDIGRKGQEQATSRIARKDTGSRWINHRDGTRSKTFTKLDVDFVDRRTSYTAWMQSMATSSNPADRAFAREALGKTRFDLVSSGKLKVQSFYYKGRLRTIDELKGLMK